MNFITELESHIAEKYTIGGKAKNLYELKEAGLNVPKWIIIPHEELLTVVPEELKKNVSGITDFIDSYSFPDSFIKDIIAHFGKTSFFAVRSSAIDEDGSGFSFAGQFDSYLYISGEDLQENIKKVWKSAFSARVDQYRKINNISQDFGIAVIVQQMIHADTAGVGFGINPINGDRSGKLISAVYGLGEGLVSGDLNSDNYILKGGDISSHIAEKSYKIVVDSTVKGGTKKVPVNENKRNKAALSESEIHNVASILDICHQKYGRPQDIEFAIADGEIHLLQARPVTNLNKIPDSGGECILWDNSNIIESYPGVTTPLTFSFISKSYEGAYKLFSEYLGVPPKVIAKNEGVFANTLGLINGRVYYNLKSWYHMLAMLPGYSINARFMENMMGVKERFDIPSDYRLSKSKAWWSIIKMGVRMYGRFLSLRKSRRTFMDLLNDTISQYKKIQYSAKSSHELMQLYSEFESKLLNEWKAPLLNDFFAMIWFGLLQKRCEQYKIGTSPNIHNDLLCGSSDIISTQPIHRSIALATSVSKDEELRKIFLSEDEKSIWRVLSGSQQQNFSRLKEEIDGYINDFGERCIGELKLESVSYTQDPTKFIKILKSYVETGITDKSTSGKIEDEIRSKAEEELKDALKNKFLKKWMLKRTLRKARELVSSRENLRYERTRAFGIVREIFSYMGKNFYAEGIIDDPRDIFYLTKEEIFAFIEGRSVTQNIKSLIDLRKEEFEVFQKMAPTSERFATYGPVYHANDFYSADKLDEIEGDLSGIGCCPGRVRAKVKVVLNPDEISSLKGDILITSSTDPGWVTLFPSASGIIVERGSVLSHSAIVSREMGKPCIVSVSGLLKTLKTGDEIEMDGGTGKIKIIGRHDS